MKTFKSSRDGKTYKVKPSDNKEFYQYTNDRNQTFLVPKNEVVDDVDVSKEAVQSKTDKG